jgi:hypothetical protein
MSLRDIEMAIVREAREVLLNEKLRLKDLMEWRSAEFTPKEGETYVFLPSLHIWASFLVPVAPPKKK